MRSQKEVIKKIKSLVDERQGQAVQYSEEGCCELAYLAKWSILEFALKELDMLRTQHDQREILKDMLRYLENGGEKPKKRKFEIPIEHKQSLPNVNQISKLVGNCSNILEIFDTKKKYRQKRNSIAHKAENLSSNVCNEYLTKLDVGIEELVDALEMIDWLAE